MAIYIDDVYQALNFGIGQQIYDLQRVEILRGPQGTTFGKNTTAGAVAFFSQTPTNVVEGYVTGRLAGGDQSRRSIEGAINLPVVDDKLAIRVSGKIEDLGNWYRDIGLNRGHGGQNSAAGRFQLRWTPDADTSVNFTAYANRQRGDASLFYRGFFNIADPCTGGFAYGTCPGGVALPTPPRNANEVRINDFPTSETVDNYGLTLRVEHDFGDVNLTSISHYRRSKWNSITDLDGTPADLFVTTNPIKSQQYGQELRLAVDPTKPLSGIFGLYYQSDRADDDATLSSFFSEPFDYLTRFQTRTKTHTYGIFGNLTYKITEDLSLTGGLRKSIENRRLAGLTAYYLVGTENPDISIGNVNSDALIPGADNILNYDVGVKAKPWTWDATVNYNPRKNLLIYARVAKGFRSGGFNLAQYLEPLGPSAFGPETIQSYEGGIKADLFDGILRVNASVYYYDYSNQQVTFSIGPVFATDNAGKSTIKGGELEVTLKPTQGLELRGNVGYSDGKYDRYLDVGTNTDYAGNRLSYTPKWTVNGTAAYTFPVTSGYDLRASTTWAYRSRVFFSADNNPDIGDRARTTGNLRLGLEPSEGRGFSLAGFVNNVTNQHAVGYSVPWIDFTSKVLSPGISYGIELGYRW